MRHQQTIQLGAEEHTSREVARFTVDARDILHATQKTRRNHGLSLKPEKKHSLTPHQKAILALLYDMVRAGITSREMKLTLHTYSDCGPGRPNICYAA